MTQPNECPPPDLLDYRGRFVRILIALIVGMAAGLGAHTIADDMAREHGQTFIIYFTGLAAIVGMAGTLGVLAYFAKRRALAERVPRAKIYKR